MMHKRHFAVILALAACFFIGSLPNESMAERAYFDITASDVRKIMVAVPNFSGDGQGPAVAQLLTKGFALHSFISVINSSRYGGGKDGDWKSLGADYVVMGQVGADPAGMMIEGQIFDVGRIRHIGRGQGKRKLRKGDRAQIGRAHV